MSGRMIVSKVPSILTIKR